MTTLFVLEGSDGSVEWARLDPVPVIVRLSQYQHVLEPELVT